MIDVKLLKISQNLVLDVRYELLVAPYRIEPCLEVRAISIAVNNEIQLNVRRGRYAQATTREIGTPDNGVLTPAVVDVIHFTMDKVRIAN